MALPGVEGGLTTRYHCAQVAAHCYRSVGVLLPVRQVHRRPDVLQAKPPRPRVEAHLPCRPTAPVVERLREALREDLSHIRLIQVLLVGCGSHPPLQETIRTSARGDSHAGEEGPPQDRHAT